MLNKAGINDGTRQSIDLILPSSESADCMNSIDNGVKRTVHKRAFTYSNQYHHHKRNNLCRII